MWLLSWYEWEMVVVVDVSCVDVCSDLVWCECVLDWYSCLFLYVLLVIGGVVDLYGVCDFNGLVWEWVDDFNVLLVGSDSCD